MSPKKNKASKEAQQLIDSLLDERTPAPQDTELKSVRFDADESSRLQPAKAGKVSDVTFSGAPFLNPTQTDSAKSKNSAVPTSSHHDDSADEATVTGGAGMKSVESHQGDDVDRFENTVRIESRSKKVKPPEPTDFTIAQEANSESVPSHTSTSDHSKFDRQGITELRTVVKMRDRGQEKLADSPRKSAAPSGGSPSFSSAEASLKQSESLRIAQGHINELKNELDRVRRENEQLVTAGETLRRRTDELISKSENLENSSRENDRIHNEEKNVFRHQLQSKDRELAEFRSRVEEMEGRLESNFKKIRVRERELEHRLEISKMESQTLIATKDKLILELKRQIDTLAQENEYGKQRAQELFNQYKDKQETIRRVVRALRIALTQLEGDEDASPGLKKVD